MLSDITTVLCDLDGVVWLAHEPIAGSVAAVATLRASGRRVMFVTNNSAATIAEHEAALDAIGIPAAGDVLSSATAAAALVDPGERVLITAGPGVAEAVEQRGASAISNIGSALDHPVAAVIVGLHRDFDYARLRVANHAVRNGARLIGTNSDTTYPTPTGLEPGGGALLAAVAAAAGTDPIVAGKPEQPMADLVAKALTTSDTEFDPTRTLMVGDRPETDGAFAHRLGCPFALVGSGVATHQDANRSVAPVTLFGADLASVVEHLH